MHDWFITFWIIFFFTFEVVNFVHRQWQKMYQWSSSNNNITLPFMMVEILMYMEKTLVNIVYTPYHFWSGHVYYSHTCYLVNYVCAKDISDLLVCAYFPINLTHLLPRQMMYCGLFTQISDMWVSQGNRNYINAFLWLSGEAFPTLDIPCCVKQLLGYQPFFHWPT